MHGPNMEWSPKFCFEPLLLKIWHYTRMLAAKNRLHNCILFRLKMDINDQSLFSNFISLHSFTLATSRESYQKFVSQLSVEDSSIYLKVRPMQNQQHQMLKQHHPTMSQQYQMTKQHF